MIFDLSCKIKRAYLARDCDCWDADAELPCWPCYRDGFDVPNAGEE
jgi:hypothetical protein